MNKTKGVILDNNIFNLNPKKADKTKNIIRREYLLNDGNKIIFISDTDFDLNIRYVKESGVEEYISKGYKVERDSRGNPYILILERICEDEYQLVNVNIDYFYKDKGILSIQN